MARARRRVRLALCAFKQGCHDAEAARDVALFLLLDYGCALRRDEVVGFDLKHFDARGRLSVLRKGKRERQLPTLGRRSRG